MLKLLFIVALALVGNEANAFVFVEPYGGYAFGKSSFTLVAAPDDADEEKYKGWGAGLRSGITLGDRMFIGVDGTYFSLETEKTEAGLTSNRDATQLLLGASAGFFMPGALRIWGGYYFKNDLEFKATETVLYKEKYSGTAWKAGVSLEFFASTQLSFEYIVSDFDTYEGNAGEKKFSEIGVSKYEHKTYFVSLSIPLGMGGTAKGSKRR